MASRTLNVVLAGDSKKFVRALSDGEKRAKAFNRALKAAAVAGTGALTAVGFSAVQRAQEIDELSKAAKVSAEEFQRLEAQARLTGGRGDDLSDVLREMTLRLQEARDLGTGPAVDALQLLGLTVQDFQGLDAPSTFARLRDAIASVDDSGQRLLLTEELLGGSSERLQGLLELNTDEYAKLIDQTKDLTIQTQQSIDATLEFNRQLSLLKDQGLARALNGALLLTDALGITDAAMAGQTSAVQQLVDVYSGEVGQGLLGTLKEYFTTTKAADTIMAENNQRLLEMAERAANATDNWRVTSEAAAQAEEQFRRTQPTLQITNSEMQLMAMGAETVGRNIDAMTQIMDNRNSSILAHANALRMAAGAYADIHNAANIASGAVAFLDPLSGDVAGAAANVRSQSFISAGMGTSGRAGLPNFAPRGGGGSGTGGRSGGGRSVKVEDDKAVEELKTTRDEWKAKIAPGFLRQMDFIAARAERQRQQQIDLQRSQLAAAQEQLGNIFGDTAGQQIVGFGIGGVNINRGQFDSQAAFHRAISNLTININGSVLSDEDKIADAVHGAMQRNAQIGR